VELFAAPNMKAVVDVPTRLQTFVQRLPPGHTLTVDRLIDERTLFPFYNPFLPADRQATLRADMAGDKGTRIHTYMGIKASRVPYPKQLRFCPRCVTLDRERYGETYWHRAHQVPGVLVCPDHSLLLQNSLAFAQPVGRFEFSSAERSIPELVRVPVSTGLIQDVHLEKLYRIAQDVAWLLSNSSLGNRTLNLAVLRARYPEALHCMGLAHQTGRIDSKKLVAAFTAYYSPALLELLGCRQCQSWLSQLTHSNNTARHPLYHLLFIQFLGYTAAEFFALPVPEHGKKDNVESQQVGPATDKEGKLQEQRIYWRRLIQKYPDAGVAALRRERPALYLWLYRNDQDWLLLNKPPSLRGLRRPLELPTTTDWAQRDILLAEKLEAAALRIKSVGTRPIRVTVAAVGREIGVAYIPMLRGHAGKLPLATGKLSQIIEQREQYAIRLVEWACGLYEAEGVMPQRWQFVKRAGVYRMYRHPLVKTAIEEALSKLAAGWSNKEEAKENGEHIAA
jgi:hypothetical protein